MQDRRDVPNIAFVDALFTGEGRKGLHQFYQNT